jgi:hypothetical protein
MPTQKQCRHIAKSLTFIYSLVDPTTQCVHYVGMTRDLLRRLTLRSRRSSMLVQRWRSSIGTTATGGFPRRVRRIRSLP